MTSDLSQRLAQLTPEKRALLEKRLQEKSGAGHNPGAEPIAIIGMSCRFPGGANSPEAFWQLLKNGVDAVTEIPAERWDANALYDPDPMRPGKMNTHWGAFLRDLDKFDREFFGLSAREATEMDPQQRMLLETAWEALEAAGQNLEQLKGSATGVFIGIHSFSSDYAWMQLRDEESVGTYTSTGTTHSIMANRISYIFDLRGPSMSVDTACSSSLVALHLACQSLRAKESHLALVGGANLFLTPATTLSFSKLRMMASHGRCKTFDASGDGFVRGEGCGMIAIKRLADAIADHDPILALIRGTAVNQDGYTNGLTAPNGLAQQQVIRRALQDAGVAPQQVSYVETHGTGTALGDPIEVEALHEVLGPARPPEAKCVLGAVKTNIGHLEGAAGIAGLIKVVLCLQHEEIPPHLHLTELNPHLQLERTPFVIPTHGYAWPRGVAPRIAGVSSFGFGGTNAHVIVSDQLSVTSDQLPEKNDQRLMNTDNRSLITDHYHLLPLSAKSSAALRALVQAYKEQLQTQHGLSLHDLVYTASLRRTPLDHRAAFAFQSKEELLGQMDEALREEALRNVRKVAEQLPGIAFVFSGQGPQWFAMGRQLLQTSLVFRAKIEACDTLMRAQANWSLLEELQREENTSRLDQTEIAQPAIFALQVALAEMWREWGIVPDAVVGHSVGEVAAAHVTGALSLVDAVRVIVHRGRLMQRATGLGKMAQVELAAESVHAALHPYRDRLALAAINSPSTSVIAGEETALEELLRAFEAREIEVRRLRVNYAFHSPQMEPLRVELENELRGLQPRATIIPMISTVTGKVIRGEELNAEYWGRNMRRTVSFAAAIASLLQDRFATFVEVSPHAVLGAAMLQCAAAQKCETTVLASLRRGQDEHATMLKALGTLYSRGYAVNWKALHPNGGKCIALPSYPWQRQSYWIANDRRAHSSTKHDSRSSLIDLQTMPQATADLLYEVQWRTQTRRDKLAVSSRGHWLIISDHAGYGEALASSLINEGCTCELIFAEENAPHELQQRLQAARTAQGLVYLSSLNQALDAAQASLPASFLLVLQTLLASEPQSRLWIITKNAQAVNDEPISLNGSALWGMGRTLALEHPELWAGLIDLGAHTPEQAAILLAEELLHNDGEDQIAFRAEQRFVARLQRAQLTPSKTISLREDRTYLITGGLGSLGLRTALWLAERGAKHIALLSRRKLPARAEWPQLEQHTQWREAIATITKLEQAGVQWRVYSAEVSDATRMTEVFAELRATMPTLAGVIHAAGVSSHRALRALAIAELQETLQPKVQGAWVLHELTRELPLDFFVLYSSISAVWGAKELGHYAAANHFLDALAHYRRSLRLPALSVNWGPWLGGGMAGEDFVTTLARTGISALQAHEAFAALEALLANNATQMVVANLQWPRFKDALELKSTRPLLAEWNVEPDAAQTSGATTNDLREQLLQTEPITRFELLTQHIQQEAAKTLGLPVTHALDASQGFFNMGMDSVMALELKTRLEKTLAVNLPRTVAFEHPSIAKLAAHLEKKFFSTPAVTLAESSAATNNAAPTVALAEIQNLSEAELAAIVDAELAQLGR